MMNTGYVGGSSTDVAEGNGLKVKISHSSTMLEALLSEEIVWKLDEDFQYLVVDIEHPANELLLSKVPQEILSPKCFYKSVGREDDYSRWVLKMHQERRQFLSSYNVDEQIISSVCGHPAKLPR
jgi:phosphoenolpyruvate carboxykinase (ATP)